MHAISSYRRNRHKQPQTHTETGPITIHCVAASAQCNDEALGSKRVAVLNIMKLLMFIDKLEFSICLVYLRNLVHIFCHSVMHFRLNTSRVCALAFRHVALFFSYSVSVD